MYTHTHTTRTHTCAHICTHTVRIKQTPQSSKRISIMSFQKMKLPKDSEIQPSLYVLKWSVPSSCSVGFLMQCWVSCSRSERLQRFQTHPLDAGRISTDTASLRMLLRLLDEFTWTGSIHLDRKHSLGPCSVNKEPSHEPASRDGPRHCWGWFLCHWGGCSYHLLVEEENYV